MAKFVSLALVAVLLPTLLALEIGLGGGIGIGIELHIPSIALATPVGLLIDLEVALAILATPYNPQQGINNCGAGHNKTKALLARNGLSSTNGRWYQDTDGTWFVAIVMDPAFSSSEVQTIYAGMIDIEQKTCMRFYIFNEADLAGFDYVRIERNAGGCYSNYIGRAHVGKQIVNLQPPACSGCGHCIWAGTSAHELLHAIGFDHQQNTPGRDSYVTIHYENIETGKEHNFDEDSASEYTAFGAPYDYGSVMHYPKDAFTKNGLDTIVVKNGAEIGQRDGLSQWDGYKVNKMHGCPT
jgi:hypothetical protein